MGEVYRARDTTLHRDVALKILPEAFAIDPDRVARFAREAQVLASLNHANIATIHGLEGRALVLELIEGPTLADRIAAGRLSLDAALDIARQIADALVAAHDQGVIHRDLKPSNIKVRADGTVKVLDFGLAKMLDHAPSHLDVSHSPTMMASVSGTLMGTAPYMAPEQAKGHDVDRRADVWAFGCVLFEMLTGRRAFDGGSTSEVIAAVLMSEPDWTRLPASTPASIRRLLRRCLEKDARARLRDIADARLEIADARHDPAPAPSTSAARPFHGERLAWASALLLTAVLAAAAWFWQRPIASALTQITFDIVTPPVTEPEDFGSMALSPDGRTLAFVAAFQGRPHLWVRSIDTVDARALQGTEDATLPFWSPDSRSIGFFGDRVVKRFDLDGGLVRTLTTATAGLGGAWNRDGVIIFPRNPASGLFRIPDTGGPSEELTRLESDHAGHNYPRFLPDDRHFLYYVVGSPAARGVYVGSLDGSVSRKLLEADSPSVYSAGHLIFQRQTTLFAQKFDLARLELQGAPFPAMEGLGIDNDLAGGGLFTATSDGTLAVRLSVKPAERRLAWLDRSGQTVQTLTEADLGLLSPVLSPSGNEVAMLRRVAGNSDVWLADTRRGALTRLTNHPGEDIFPIWSADGRSVIFTSNRTGTFGFYQKDVSGGEEKLILPAIADEVFPSDASSDGTTILYQRRSVATSGDLYALSLTGSGASTLLFESEYDERDPQLSPDGRWVAYQANNSGRFEIYVRPFPGPGPAIAVTTGGGAGVRWRSDGRELFYLALDATLMAVPITPGADRQSLDVGSPVGLFPSRLGRVLRGNPGAMYDVAPDGNRFLLNVLPERLESPPIRLILNWQPKEQSPSPEP
jgi:eukaryotic-like serine/threonine-protein kinase